MTKSGALRHPPPGIVHNTTSNLTIKTSWKSKFLYRYRPEGIFRIFFGLILDPPPGTYAFTAKKGKFICTGHFFPHGMAFLEKKGGTGAGIRFYFPDKANGCDTPLSEGRGCLEEGCLGLPAVLPDIFRTVILELPDVLLPDIRDLPTLCDAMNGESSAPYLVCAPLRSLGQNKNTANGNTASEN